MIEIKNHLVDTWWIIKKNDNSVIHHGITPVGLVTQSGLDEKETFTEELVWANTLLSRYSITATTSDNIVLVGDIWVNKI
jgi:hypothetical protein